MSREHELKIKECFMQNIENGRKSFEVRFNDRDFQVDDTIKFSAIEDLIDGVSECVCIVALKYRIIYVHSGIGLKKGYVVLSIKPITKEGSK